MEHVYHTLGVSSVIQQRGPQHQIEMSALIPLHHADIPNPKPQPSPLHQILMRSFRDRDHSRRENKAKYRLVAPLEAEGEVVACAAGEVENGCVVDVGGEGGVDVVMFEGGGGGGAHGVVALAYGVVLC